MFALLFNRNWLCRTKKRKRHPAGKLASSGRTILQVESLEDRAVPSNIVWDNFASIDPNQGLSSFINAYDDNAGAAIAIVNRAMQDWERVIQSFNYADGSGTFYLDISAAAMGARASTAITQVDAQGRPMAATINIDSATNRGWYFDPEIGYTTVPDDGEFTILNGRFEAQVPDPTQTTDDFYRTVLHEIGHALGISTQRADLRINNFLTPMTDALGNPVLDQRALTNTGTVAQLLSFNAGGVSATFTSPGTQGLHIYEGSPLDTVNMPVNPNDLMNSGRVMNAQQNPNFTTTRQIIGDIDAAVLRAAYGYTIPSPRIPSNFNTFYVNLDRTNDLVTVQGNPGSSADTILIDNDGFYMRFEVNGTYEEVPIHEVDEIRVATGAGRDTIEIRGLPSSIDLVINAGSSSDVVRIGDGDLDTKIEGDVHVDGGGGGNDQLRLLDDDDNVGDDRYTITEGTFDKTAFPQLTFEFVDRLYLYASPHHNTIDVEISSVSDLNRVYIYAGDGEDTTNIEALLSNIDLRVEGDGDDDTFNVGRASEGRRVHGDVVLRGEQGKDTFNINALASNGSVNANGGSDDDTFHIGEAGQGDIDSKVHGDVLVSGTSGTDKLTIHDQSDSWKSWKESYTLTATTFSKSIVSKPSDKPESDVDVEFYVESLVLDANDYGTTINVESTSKEYVLDTLDEPWTETTSMIIYANGGSDTVNIGDGNLDTDMQEAVGVSGGSGAGTDIIRIYDQLDTGNDDYDLSALTLTKTAESGASLFGGLLFSGFEDLVLYANTGDNNININSTSANTSVTAYGGDGSDLFLLNTVPLADLFLDGSNSGSDDDGEYDALLYLPDIIFRDDGSGSIDLGDVTVMYEDME